MKKKYATLLKQIARVIYKEVFQDDGIVDKIPLEYQDLFHSIEYWKVPESRKFSTKKGNWQKLSDSKTQKTLRSEIYCYVCETDTHYFVTFTSYHATDWKWIGGHDNDLESIHYVVKKKGDDHVIQIVYISPHHSQHIYYNHEYYGDRGEKKNFRKIIFDAEGRPIIYCQPGNATKDLWNLFNLTHLGKVGHGLYMAGHGNRISGKEKSPKFNSKKGYLCRYDSTRASLYKNNLLRGNEVKEINYGLIDAKRLWELKKNEDLFKTKLWHPKKNRFKHLPDIEKRFERLKRDGTPSFDEKNSLPSTMKGKKKFGGSRPKSLFVLSLTVSRKTYDFLRFGRVYYKNDMGLMVTMDPVLAWKIKMTEIFKSTRYANEIGTEYRYHPCINIYK